MSSDLGDPGPFTLGTVQLGQPYGLGAARSLLDAGAASAVLDTAAAAGIRWLDTAAAYGQSESRIGEWHSRTQRRFRIVSKLPSLANISDEDCAAEVARSIEGSMSRLRCGRIDIYLAHRGADLLRPPIVAALRRAQDEEKIGRFGGSVYTTDDALSVLQVAGVGAMQIPLSAVAQDPVRAGILDRVAARDVALFARSVFLQGALLLDPERLPPHLAQLAAVNTRMRQIASEAEISLPGLLVAAVKSFSGVYSPVLGVDDARQLSDLVQTARERSLDRELVEQILAAGRGLPAALVDPRQWPHEP